MKRLFLTRRQLLAIGAAGSRCQRYIVRLHLFRKPRRLHGTDHRHLSDPCLCAQAVAAAARILRPADVGAGGQNAQIGGIMTLTAGEVLQIAVGGMGGLLRAWRRWRGGSFVVGPGNTPLVIAGGGGGGGASTLGALPPAGGVTGPNGGAGAGQRRLLAAPAALAATVAALGVVSHPVVAAAEAFLAPADPSDWRLSASRGGGGDFGTLPADGFGGGGGLRRRRRWSWLVGGGGGDDDDDAYSGGCGGGPDHSTVPGGGGGSFDAGTTRSWSPISRWVTARSSSPNSPPRYPSHRPSRCSAWASPALP